MNIGSFKLKAAFGCACVASAFFAACGDSNTTEVIEKVDANISCETEVLDDSTGIRVMCNGDSIGVVYNGENGSDGKDGNDGSNGKNGNDGLDGKDGKDGKDGLNGNDGVGCAVVSSTKDSVKVACDTTEFSLFIPVVALDSADVDPDVEALVDVQVSGATQKGPFIEGTSVTAYELLNGRTLKQTGKTFSGTIESNDGLFNIKTVKLSSQYAYMIADGYYRNEVTGEKSNAQIRLRALTNLKGRKKANINLMTHLEYPRVVSLVTDSSYSVANAKKTAQKDVLSSFYIKPETIGNSEDLTIFGDGEGDAALLAISIMLQGDRSEAELTSLLSSFSDDISKDGSWDNLSDRADVADWAMEQEIYGEGLGRFRSNVEAWKLGTVPKFEPYVRNFWYEELKLGVCNDSTKNNVVNVSNHKSKYYSAAVDSSSKTDGAGGKLRLTCDEKSHLWRASTQIEMDTVGWGAKAKSGAVRNGNFDATSVYVFENGAWRRGTELDNVQPIGGCNASTVDSVRLGNDGTYYKCVDTLITLGESLIKTAWREASFIERNTWNAASGSEVVYGSVETNLVFVLENGAWRKGNKSDAEYGFGGCTEKRLGERQVLENKTEDWPAGTIFYCVQDNDDTFWSNVATAVLLYPQYVSLKWETGKFAGQIKTYKEDGIVYGYFRYGMDANDVVNDVWNKIPSDNYLILQTYDYANDRDWDDPAYHAEYCVEDGIAVTGNLPDGQKYPESFVCNAGKFEYVGNSDKYFVGYYAETQNQELWIKFPFSCVSYTLGKKATYVDEYSYHAEVTAECTDDGWVVTNVEYPDTYVYDLRESNVRYKPIKISVGSYSRTWLDRNAYIDLDSSGRYFVGDSVYGSSLSTYGRYYNYAQAENACPLGYRLPTKQEWEELLDAVGGSNVAGASLKSTSGWTTKDGAAGNGTNSYKLNILPAGGCFNQYLSNFGTSGFNLKCSGFGNTTSFWTSTDYYSQKEMVSFYASEKYAYTGDHSPVENNYYSVRCIKDKE